MSKSNWPLIKTADGHQRSLSINWDHVVYVEHHNGGGATLYFTNGSTIKVQAIVLPS